MTVEELFEAEAKLRMAARDYSSNEHSQQSIECRRRHARELRQAARNYTRIENTFEEAIAASLASKESACDHLAISNTPAANLMTEPCPNCGRYYVNDDNSVETGGCP